MSDVQRWAQHLADTALQGDRPSGSTVRHHLNALSNLYRRAQSEGVVPPGYNPVAAMLEEPAGRRLEARWLEVPDVALLLAAAARPLAPVNGHPTALAHPLLAMFLFTGGRAAEVLGLEVADVSFDRKTVTFRPNGFRRLKTPISLRSVPLWPQLEEILGPYADQRVVERGGTLLFPGRGGQPDHRLAEAARSGGRPGGLAAGRYSLEDVPAHLLRGAAPDARPRRAGPSVHRGPRART
jgi:integrase